jgi:hypothetical protein
VEAAVIARLFEIIVTAIVGAVTSFIIGRELAAWLIARDKKDR